MCYYTIWRVSLLLDTPYFQKMRLAYMSYSYEFSKLTYGQRLRFWKRVGELDALKPTFFEWQLLAGEADAKLKAMGE